MVIWTNLKVISCTDEQLKHKIDTLQIHQQTWSIHIFGKE